MEKRVTLPAELKGYMALREAKLNDASWDVVETWTEGSWEYDEIIENLKRLERPAPSGKGSGHRLRGSSSQFVGYQGDEDME